MGKPKGSDEKLHKSTYVSLYSLEKAEIIYKKPCMKPKQYWLPTGKRPKYC